MLSSQLSDGPASTFGVRCLVFAIAPEKIDDETIKRLDEWVEQWLSPWIQMKRELKPEEHEEIVKAVSAGDRVKATSLYLSATGGDLTSAQNFIKTLILEKQAAESEPTAKERG